jgi:hypothetical protein
MRISPREKVRCAGERPWLLLVPWLLSACASTSSSGLRLYPIADGPTGAAVEARLTRACQVGDCRVQRATLTLPDGEVLQGEFRLLAAGADSATLSEAPSGPLGVPAPTPGRGVGLPATMTVRGNRGTRMRCEMTLSRTGQHGTGLCWSSRGEVFRLEI